MLSLWIDDTKEKFERRRAEQRRRGERESEERQPVWRALDALLHVIIRTIETCTQVIPCDACT